MQLQRGKCGSICVTHSTAGQAALNLAVFLLQYRGLSIASFSVVVANLIVYTGLVGAWGYNYILVCTHAHAHAHDRIVSPALPPCGTITGWAWIHVACLCGHPSPYERVCHSCLHQGCPNNAESPPTRLRWAAVVLCRVPSTSWTGAASAAAPPGWAATCWCCCCNLGPCCVVQRRKQNSASFQ